MTFFWSRTENKAEVSDYQEIDNSSFVLLEKNGELMATLNYKLTGKYLPPKIFILGICFLPGVTEISNDMVDEIRQFIKKDRLLQHYLEQKILIIQD